MVYNVTFPASELYTHCLMACGWSIFVSAEYEIKSTSQDMLVKYAVSMKLSKHISIWKTHLGLSSILGEIYIFLPVLLLVTKVM